MDGLSKAFYWLIGIVSFLFIFLLVISMLQLNNKTEECTEKNGVMVRTVAGWRCVDVKVLQ